MKFKINEKIIVAVAAVVFFAAFAAIIYFDQPHGEVGAGYGSNEVVFDIEKGTGHISSVDIPDDLLILGMGQEASLSFPVMNTDLDNDVDTVVITIPGATVTSSEYEWFEAGEHIWNLDNTTADDVVDYSAEVDYAGSAYGGSEYYDVADDDALDAIDNTTGEEITFTVGFTVPDTPGFMTGTSAITVEASDMIEEATGDTATVEYPYLIAEDNDVFIICILQPSGFDLTIRYGDQTLFGGSRASDYETSPYGMKYTSEDQQVAIVDKPAEGTVVMPIITPQAGVSGEFNIKWFEFTVTDITTSAVDTTTIEEDYIETYPDAWGWTGPLDLDLDDDGILNAVDPDIDGDGYANDVDPGPYNPDEGNSAPTGLVASADVTEIKEGDPVTLSALATDGDGDTLTYTWSNNVDDQTWTGENWTLTDLKEGTYIFTVSVTDGVNDPVTYDVTVVVEKKDDEPCISPIVIILIVIVVLAIIGAIVFFVMKGKGEDEEEAPTEIAPEGEGTYVEDQYEEPGMFGEAPPMEGPPAIDEPVPSYEEPYEPEEAAAELPPAVYEEQVAPETAMGEESQEVQDLESLIDDLEAEEGEEDVCPECGTPLEPTDSECPGCGAQFEVALECPSCGGAVAETDEACPSCGVAFV